MGLGNGCARRKTVHRYGNDRFAASVAVCLRGSGRCGFLGCAAWLCRGPARALQLQICQEFLFLGLALLRLLFFPAFDGLGFGLVQRPAERGFHTGRLGDAEDVMTAGLDADFGCLTVFFRAQDDMRAGCPAENLGDSLNALLRQCAECRGNGHLSAGVLNLHGESSLPKQKCPPRMAILPHPRTRRWWVLGIRRSSRYFATVRRVTLMPWLCSMAAI